MNTTFLTGMILTVSALWVRYQIGRRRFNRRSIGGLQQFPTYSRFIMTMFIEKAIYFLATLCLWAGLFLLAIAAFTHFKF